MKSSVLRWAALVAFLVPGPSRSLAGEPEMRRGPGTERDSDCLVCHAGIGEEDAPKLDSDVYRRTAHGQQGCIGCHTDVEDPTIQHEEPDEDLAPVQCGSCHLHARAQFAGSIHANEDRAKRADLEAATCVRCHGAHDIRAPDDPRSSTNRLRQASTCGSCHGRQRSAAGHRLAATADLDGEIRVEVVDDGPTLDASCTECHGSHDIRTSTNAASRLFPGRVATTCGQCHDDQREEFATSAHAEAARKEGFDWHALAAEQAPPVCTTCHRMHDAGAPKSARFRYELVHECGTCHEALMKTYVQSYHGKATLLGEDAVAKCSDCHGFHDIRGPDEPESKVAPGNKLETCQKCHEGASENFAGFWAHADPSDPQSFPILNGVVRCMNLLLISVFTFFGLHTLLWAIREAVDTIRLRGQPRRCYRGPRIQRFTTTDRVLHFFVIISFLGLAATGAPLKYAQASWAKSALWLLGGVQVAGILHRVFAVMTFGYFFAHLGQLAKNLGPAFRERRLLSTLLGPDSLVPRGSDFTDIVAHFAWFLGLGKKPTWERWTYWEKFDYWAVFWGVAIIGSSGLILWFPERFTQILPGWVINISLVVHSDEALLAIGIIFGVHFFNSHLRRSKFPMDEVMFTGSLPEEEFREERQRQWLRLEAEGRADEQIVEAPHPVFRAWSRVFGISAWLSGLVILGLIIHGFLTTH